MRKVIYALVAMVAIGTMHSDAQFLKGLKDKAKKAANEAVQKVTKTSPSKTSTSKGEQTEEKVSPFLKKCHHGTMDSNLRPRKSADMNAKIKVDVGNSMTSWSRFSEGVAYVYNYDGPCFFIDKTGKKLFETEMKESETSRMPMFDNGVVMIMTPPSYNHSESRKVRIYDKKGTLVKEIPDAVYGSNFVDGIAYVAIPYKVTDLTENYYIKYVDTKGNFVFPELTFKSLTTNPGTESNYSYSVRRHNIVRESSDNLTAFITKVDGKFRWGFRDSVGKVVIKPEYEAVGDFHDGVAAVSVPPVEKGALPKWGFVDKTGKMVIPAKYTIRPSDFNTGYSLVANREGDTYYIDLTGSKRLGPVKKTQNIDENNTDGQFTYISPFCDGYAIAGFIVQNPNGYPERYFGVIDPLFNVISYGKLDSDPEIVLKVEGCHYLSQGNTLYRFDPRTFDMLGQTLEQPFFDGLSVLSREGWVDMDGDLYIGVVKDEF